MPASFASDKFFSDPFFTKADANDTGYVDIARLDGTTATLRSVYRHGLDPKRDGELIQRGGHWADAAVLARDYTDAFGAGTEPQIHEVWQMDGEDFRIEAHSKDGDVFNVKALSSQRRTR
jgi:hypothetical protein